MSRCFLPKNLLKLKDQRKFGSRGDCLERRTRKFERSARDARKIYRQDTSSALQLRLGELLHPERKIPEPHRGVGRGAQPWWPDWPRRVGQLPARHAALVVNTGTRREAGS